MLINYIKSAHRNVIRNKVQSLIQIVSLSLGIAVFSLVAFYLYDEFTVERSNPFFTEIYRVELPNNPWEPPDRVRIPMGPFIVDNIPEIRHMTRVRYQPKVPVVYMDKTEQITETTMIGVIDVDHGFQEVFPQVYMAGDPLSSLSEPKTIVLTESAAKRLFGEKNPMGETVYLWRGPVGARKVTGIVKDPVNDHLHFEALLSLEEWINMRMQRIGFVDPGRIRSSLPTYVRIQSEAERTELADKIGKLWASYAETTWGTEPSANEDVYLRSLKEVQFADMDPYNGYTRKSDRRKLMNFLYLGLGTLLLGIINYINLATARASSRSREIVVRKIHGSSRGGMVFFFLTESMITTFFSFLVAATLVQLLFQNFNEMIQADMNLYFLRLPFFWAIELSFILLTGTIAGLYPAFRLSRLSPQDVFIGGQKRGSGLIFRRILLVVQFSSAVILLLAIFTMQRQIDQMKIQDPKFPTEQLVYMQTGSLGHEKNKLLRERLERIPEIRHATFSYPFPGLLSSDESSIIDDPNSVFHGLNLYTMYADPEFFDVYGLNFTQGGEILQQSRIRDWYESESIDSALTFYIINETCRTALGLEDAVGYEVGTNKYIMGVVEDFHFQSFRYPIKPMAILLVPVGSGYLMSVKMDSPDPERTMEQILEAFGQLSKGQGSGNRLPGVEPVNWGPNDMFTYVAENYKRQYKTDERIRNASICLTMMAVLIACLGLFGLSTFLAQQRTREIGIRRVNGSSEKEIFWLLVLDFMKWVGLSLLIGLPAGWFIMRSWQQQFAYRAGTVWWFYVATILIVVFVSLATVGIQAYRTSRSNPANSLRTE